MKNKKFFIVGLILITLILSLSAVSADDLSTVAEGSVSGGVDVATEAPFAPNVTSAELSYDVPEDVSDVQYAGLYVNVYSGSANTSYGLESNISMTSNGETSQIASERLVSTEGSTDGTVYVINDHTTKCYSDYQMMYNITDKVQGATGQLKFNVVNSALEDYNFDGRIKLVGLVFAYNDNDNEKYGYWVNSGQSWLTGGATTSSVFDVGTLNDDYEEASIVNVALSSTDGNYTFNGNLLDEGEHQSASMYQYHKWDLTGNIQSNANTLVYSRSGSFKNVLSVLTVYTDPYTHIYANVDGTGSGSSMDDPISLVTALKTLANNTMVHVLDGEYVATKDNDFAVRANNSYIVAVNPGNAVFSGNDAYRITRIFSSNVTLDGLTFTHGKGAGALVYLDSAAKDSHIVNCVFRDNTNKGSSGAGALYIAVDDAIIEDCSFLNNFCNASTGAGSVYVTGNNVIIKGCNFENSSAYRDGGAIRWYNKENGQVIDCNFTNCKAAVGGAIAWAGVNGKVTGCIFKDNAANSTFTSTSNANRTGGAIFWSAKYGLIDNCTFINNFAPASGGAIYWGASQSNGTVMNSIFKDNTAQRDAGAIFWSSSANEGRVLYCSFENNKAIDGSGGAILWRGDNSHIAYSNFTNNSANLNGSALYIGSNVANMLDLAYCIFEDNSAETLNYTVHNQGGHLYLDTNTINNESEDSINAIYNNGTITSPVYLFIVVNSTDPVDNNVAVAVVGDTVPIDVYIVDDNLNTINGDGLSLIIGETTITEFEMDKDIYKANYEITEWGNYFVSGKYSHAKEDYINILTGTIVAGEAYHSATVSLKSEYENVSFAGTENVIEVTLLNNGAFSTDYLVEFYADDKLIDSYVTSLSVGFSATSMVIDPTIRPVDEFTKLGNDNRQVNYTVIVKDNETGEILTNESIFPDILYNGNLAKDLAYPAENISLFNAVTFNGGIIIDTKTTYSSASAPGRTDIWNIAVPDDASFVNAYVYVAYNWDKTEGDMPEWTTSFNELAVTNVAQYRDQSNMGKYGKYGYGLIVYDVSSLIKNGENKFSLSKTADLTAVYPSTLVVIYNVSESDTIKTLYMFNGADLLSNSNNLLERTVASNSVLDIDADASIIASELMIFAAGAQPGEGNLIINNETFEDVWDADSSYDVSEFDLSLGNSPKASNEVSFVATGSTILALQQFILLEYEPVSAKASLNTEYSNSVFAGTDNVLKLNLTNTGFIPANFTVDLYADGIKVNSTEIELDVGENTQEYLIDPLIRDVTENTVNGAENDKVNYTVVISNKATGNPLDEISITPSLLYNGYLGKDLAYPAENISLFNTITVNGGAIISSLNDSTYLASGSTNRTDIWTLELNEDASFVNAYVYVAYNWDKTNGTIPVWNTAFNGVSVSPVASYRDQSNLGSYGKFGYGLFVYDVSDLIKSGENSFKIEKEIGLTAVYPSTLVALFNQTVSDSITTIYMYNGADLLLANSYNFLGRAVESNSVLDIDSFDNVINADLLVFAASAQAGEGNLIVNDDIYEDVWNGSSNSVNVYDVDLGTSPKESNAVSFVATGSTILALQQFVIIEYEQASVKAALSSEYNNAAFAGTENVLKLELSNDGTLETDYLIDFYVDGILVNSTEVSLENGANDTLYLVDDTIRPVTENTVNGADNAKVNYTVVISDKATGEVYDEITLTPSVLYNGNLGKDLAYPAGTIESFNNITVNGGVIIDTLGDSTYLGSKTTNRTDLWTVEVPDDAAFANAYVYVAYNWDKTNGTIPVWTTAFNGVSVSPVASYRDQSNLGTYGKYGYGLVIYDVTDLIKAGENSFTLEKEEGMTAVYPSTLVALYNVTDSDTLTTVYLYNGADLLSNANNFNGRLVASDSVLSVEGIDDIEDAVLYVFAASAQSGEGNLIINNQEFVNVWNGSSNSVDAYVLDLTDSIKDSNAVSFVATGSTILALEQFVLIKKYNPYVKASLTSEYSNTAFAGTDNVLKLNVTSFAGDTDTFVVDFYIDGKKVNSTELALEYGGSEELLLVDDIIRPVTADTVNGASTTKVNYTVIITDKKSGDVLAEVSINPTLLYNGNLGKDLAYPAGTIESFNNITVNGGVIIDTLGDSTYLGSKTTNRTDLWTVEVPDDAAFANAYVYVAYNWDKTNGTIPVWTTAFNGVSVSPVASYRDQSNLGTYGKYGYGLVIYDVTDLIKAGENSFTLEKEEGMTAVYPSTLVALYNVTDSDTLTTVYLYNGADLLSNANNFNGRLVASDSVLSVDDGTGINEAALYVFAASAQTGEGNLIVNGNEFANVWNGSSNSVDAYVIDLTDSIKESNNVSFIATGSTIVALEQFVIVKSIVLKTSEDLQKLIDAAKPGDILDLANDTYVDVANVNITKNLTITGGIINGKEGEAIFIVPSKSEGGPEEVNITGVDFKVNNGNVIVKAAVDNGTSPLSIDTAAITIDKNTIAVANDKVVPESVTVLELDSERGSLAPSSEIAVKGNTMDSGINPFEFEVIGVVGENGDVLIPENGTVPERQATVIQYQDMTTTAVNVNIEGRVGKYFEVNLTDANGNPLADKAVQIGFNGKIYNRTTNATGGAKLQINLAAKGTYTFAISFLGDDNYNASFVVSKITVNQQKTKLTTANKSYKASAKTKTLTATLKSSVYNKAINGKKVTFTVNGKTYSPTTNSKGVATVKVSLSSKKTYSFTAKFAGNIMYAALTVKGKITIK